ncbi:hypothetical protein EJ06DRAFT_584419 [Trichodelitschia bisporula]|uniref:Uncharacterized protein n=1 Tax=Trichodelitschia bisporula TaxID=703511 RepID=A0A6G1HNP8_9PEZI|nr:hypothetical protein EJ06DRAFT_584419 [Trichodelitschia bisporula]
MLSKTLVSFGLMLAGAAMTGALPLDERASSSTFKLYAYGMQKELGGLPMYYADGLAYAGEKLSTASVISDITLAASANDAKSWVIQSAASNSTGADIVGQALYISPSQNAAVGFVSGTPDSGKTTTGFTSYGSLTFWTDPSSGDWKSSFYAVPVSGQDGIWAINWLADSKSAPDNAIPIGLKRTAPGRSSGAASLASASAWKRAMSYM